LPVSKTAFFGDTAIKRRSKGHYTQIQSRVNAGSGRNFKRASRMQTRIFRRHVTSLTVKVGKKRGKNGRKWYGIIDVGGRNSQNLRKNLKKSEKISN